jgi:hypothetical protein
MLALNTYKGAQDGIAGRGGRQGARAGRGGGKHAAYDDRRGLVEN